MASRGPHTVVRKAPVAEPELLDIGLTHGKAMWVLQQLGFAEGVSQTTFNYYIKSLRKLGIPFLPGENRFWSGRLARYSYYHLMELALALTLRVYGAVPDSILEGIIANREALQTIYDTSYAERGREITIEIYDKDHGPLRISAQGVYLDLALEFSGGRLLKFGPPQLLDAHAAVTVFLRKGAASRAFFPIAISKLSHDVVSLARHAPPIHRGPQPDLPHPHKA
ncbi:MAG TPA: hypothetical protein VNQ56_06650 [Pseudolabrys sp.]|nr:hypothetical protein [Pseudolabrys sp.]